MFIYTHGSLFYTNVSLCECFQLPDAIRNFKINVLALKQINSEFQNFMVPDIQGVPGGMCQTSGECSLC